MNQNYINWNFYRQKTTNEEIQQKNKQKTKIGKNYITITPIC